MGLPRNQRRNLKILGDKWKWKHSGPNLYNAAKAIFFNVFIYFWDREKTLAAEGQRERGRERTPSRLYCQHRAWRGTWSQKPWDHDLSHNWATQAKAILRGNLIALAIRAIAKAILRGNLIALWAYLLKKQETSGVPGWLSGLSVQLQLRSWSCS